MNISIFNTFDSIAKVILSPSKLNPDFLISNPNCLFVLIAFGSQSP